MYRSRLITLQCERGNGPIHRTSLLSSRARHHKQGSCLVRDRICTLPPLPSSHACSTHKLTRTSGIRLRHSTLMVPSPPHQRPDLPHPRLRPSRSDSRTQRHRLTHQHHRRSLCTNNRQRHKRQRHSPRGSHPHTQRHRLHQRHRGLHTRQQRHSCRRNRERYHGWRC